MRDYLDQVDLWTRLWGIVLSALTNVGGHSLKVGSPIL